jgi:hypothetical protein
MGFLRGRVGRRERKYRLFTRAEDQDLNPGFIGCVTMGRPLKQSELQFVHL